MLHSRFRISPCLSFLLRTLLFLSLWALHFLFLRCRLTNRLCLRRSVSVITVLLVLFIRIKHSCRTSVIPIYRFLSLIIVRICCHVLLHFESTFQMKTNMVFIQCSFRFVLILSASRFWLCCLSPAPSQTEESVFS